MTGKVPTFLRYTILFTAGMGSMMFGSSLVHNFYKPNLAIPDLAPALPPSAPHKPREES